MKYLNSTTLGFPMSMARVGAEQLQRLLEKFRGQIANNFRSTSRDGRADVWEDSGFTVNDFAAPDAAIPEASYNFFMAEETRP